MERVVCIKCGSVGYTASPEQVNCLECGSNKHKVIQSDYKKPSGRNRTLSLIPCLAKG